MGVVLNEQVITELLRELCEHLGAKDLEQAEMTLDTLDFERLLRPIDDQSKLRRLHSVDSAEGFGVERVHETGDYLRTCRLEIKARRPDAAFQSAERALGRWLAEG